MIFDQPEAGRPLSRFRDPGLKDGQGTNHERWSSLLSFILLHELEKREGLNSLSQPHLVTQDPADTVVLQVNQERKTIELIRL